MKKVHKRSLSHPLLRGFSRLSFFFIVIILLSVLGALVLNVVKTQKKDQNNTIALQPTVTPSPTPTPIILKPDEGKKGNYSISQGDRSKGPVFFKVTFDPLDVQKGQKLTITVSLSSSTPVTSVAGTLMGDTTTMPITFTRVSTTDATSVWSGTVSVGDTLKYKYILTLTGSDASGTSSVTVAPRS